MINWPVETSNGRLTTYRETRFRSRLEARWAAFFDELGWAWWYEPWFGDHYLPDFVVGVDETRPLLVEVKPAHSSSELLPHAAKVINGVHRHWPHEVIMVGVEPAVALLAVPHSPCITAGVTAGAWAAALEATDSWPAQERYRYGDAAFNLCRHCSRVGVGHRDEENGDELSPCGHCCSRVQPAQSYDAVSAAWSRATRVIREIVDREEMATLTWWWNL